MNANMKKNNMVDLSDDLRPEYDLRELLKTGARGKYAGRCQRMKAYPAYKASGLEWLGEIPAHWEIIRVKQLAGNNSDVVQTGPFGAQLHASDYVDNGVPLILIRNVNNLWIDDSDIPKISEEKAQALSMYRVQIGDIVFSRVGSIGRIAMITKREEGWLISGQMLRMRINNSCLDPHFSLYGFSANLVSEYIAYYSVGSTRESINTDILRNIPIPLPPINEQRAIAAYLDHKTRLIDTYITKKQQQVERWQAYRAALINQAVTKGLNPDVPMKASGIEWLGDIPAHWKRAKLKHIANFKSGDSITATDINETGRFPVYGGNGIRGYTDRFTHNGNFILIGRQGALCGNVHYTEGCFWASEHAIVVYLQTDYDVFWLGELLRTMNLNQYSLAAAQPGLAVETIRNLTIPIPPKIEQQSIASYIKKQTAKIDTLAAATQRQLERLHAYRAALISEVVTGKIDVRGELMDNQ